MNRMTEAYCINCQSAKAFSNFHNHVIVGKKYLPICKTCCNKKLKDYIVNNSNFEIVEIKNYLEDGHPEDPNYKALHIRMKYQKFPCEVEFMDVKMFEHVVRTHDDYKKGLLK